MVNNGSREIFVSTAAKQLHSGKLARKLAKTTGGIISAASVIQQVPETVMTGSRRSILRSKAANTYETLLDQLHAHVHHEIIQAAEEGRPTIFTDAASVANYRAILDTLARYSVGSTVEVNITDREALAIFVRTTAPYIAPEQFEPWRKALLAAFEAHAQGETVIDVEVAG